MIFDKQKGLHVVLERLHIEWPARLHSSRAGTARSHRAGEARRAQKEPFQSPRHSQERHTDRRRALGRGAQAHQRDRSPRDC